MYRDVPIHDETRSAFLDRGGNGPPDLTVQLQLLLELITTAVPTCIGISLVVCGPDPALTVTASRPGWQDEPVLASLSLRLPRAPIWPPSDGGAELVIYAGTAHAFRDTAPTLLSLFDLRFLESTSDAHLKAPDLTGGQAALERWLDDQTGIDRALGNLLGRGITLEDGRLELARLAAADATAARA